MVQPPPRERETKERSATSCEEPRLDSGEEGTTEDAGEGCATRYQVYWSVSWKFYFSKFLGKRGVFAKGFD